MAGAGLVAAVGGALAALPVAGGHAERLVRGAVLRRVAECHGVRLGPEARRVLVGPPPWSRARRLVAFSVGAVTWAGGQIVRPLRLATTVEAALALYGTVWLFDRHLRRRASGSQLGREPVAGSVPTVECGVGRESSALFDASEARRFRRASDDAEVRAVLSSLWTVPKGVGRGIRRGVTGFVRSDVEERRRLERLVDGFFDATASLPAEVGEALGAAFDRAWKRAGEDLGEQSARSSTDGRLGDDGRRKRGWRGGWRGG